MKPSQPNATRVHDCAVDETVATLVESEDVADTSALSQINALVAKCETRWDAFLLAFKLSIPTMSAYFPLGIVFGVLFCHLDYAWYYAPIMSALVYGGSVQFVALGLIAKHSSYIEILLATLFIALRNSFYGLHLLDRYKTQFWRQCYLIHGLVDSNYAILMTTPRLKAHLDTAFCFFLTICIKLSWVIGTLLGAAFSGAIPELPGLEFMLTCFFLVLVIEQYYKAQSWVPVGIAVMASAIGIVITPTQWLITAILLSVVFLSVWMGRASANRADAQEISS